MSSQATVKDVCTRACWQRTTVRCARPTSGVCERPWQSRDEVSAESGAHMRRQSGDVIVAAAERGSPPTPWRCARPPARLRHSRTRVSGGRRGGECRKSWVTNVRQQSCLTCLEDADLQTVANETAYGSVATSLAATAGVASQRERQWRCSPQMAPHLVRVMTFSNSRNGNRYGQALHAPTPPSHTHHSSSEIAARAQGSEL